MCNHDDFYLVDADFGPLFSTFCSYFPDTARVCLNGHEYVKRQLAKAGIPFEALDSGLLGCADPSRAQRILLEVETLGQDCLPGEAVFDQVNQPQVVAGQRTSGLHLDDPRVPALFTALCLFLTPPEGFRRAGCACSPERARAAD